MTVKSDLFRTSLEEMIQVGWQFSSTVILQRRKKLLQMFLTLALAVQD